MNQRQQRLFDTTPDPWELDDAAAQPAATIVLPDVPGGPYDYAIPGRLGGQVEPGRRVRVPFGRGDRLLDGYCVEVRCRAEGGRRLKEIREVLDPAPVLAPTMLRLTQWMAEHYLCDWGQVLKTVLPAPVRGVAGTRRVTLLRAAPDAALRLAEGKLPPKQAAALATLARSPRPMTAQQLARAAGCTVGPIEQLRRKRLVTEEDGRVLTHRGDEKAAVREPHHPLHPDQQQALDAIAAELHAGRHAVLLLHGVTGSGKTEVYIRAIEEVVRFGRQAIVLVPEISLTPQTRQRFRARFDHVAVLHSHLTDAERHFHWRRIAAGEIQVVVGARSAVFAPLPHLGLIVIDEEHDGSFKQESAPRYHARDVALRRAEMLGIPLVLGSATPSLESWYAATSGRWRLLELPERVFGRPLPDVATIDLRTEWQSRRHRGAVSRQLQAAIGQALQAGGQVILLLNRRGFSTHIQCPACGEVVRCPDCEVALTHHRTEVKAVCHYCDYHTLPPASCPACNAPDIRYSGIGTERLEAEVRARFPDAATLRMDTDTMRRPGAHEEALARFRRGEVRILLGTQMIAKGLDFPDVTLVGVINADIALHLPDFRAGERTFQLVTQVAGRTGRGEKGGRVLVQTFSPEHPAIVCAVRHDFHRFAAQELPTREQYGYPPLTSMIRLIVRGGCQPEVRGTAEELGRRIRQWLAEREPAARVLGPAAAPIAKLKGKYRDHLLLFAPQLEPIRAAVAAAGAALTLPGDVQWTADVDPLDML